MEFVMVKVFLLDDIILLLKEVIGCMLLRGFMDMWLDVKNEFKFGSGIGIVEFM